MEMSCCTRLSFLRLLCRDWRVPWFSGASRGLVSAALPYIFCGFWIVCGCLVIAVGGSDLVLLQIGLGPIRGPQGGRFASGVIAAPYAAGIRKNHPTGHAKDILSPLVDTSGDMLAIGGIFALVGHALAQFLPKILIIV